MFRYFGSKARLAPTYQSPKYDLIVEPFAGAAGYSMYWLQERSDLRCELIDCDPLVVEMWTHLFSMDPTELWHHPDPVQGERTDDITYLIATAGAFEWQTFAKHRSVKVTEWMARDFPGRKQICANTLARVRGRVDVRVGDYTDAPDVAATWFIDPPYQLDGSWYDSGNALDFPAIGEWAQTRRGQTIVCESQGATWMPFKPHRANRTVIDTQSIEVVWYSLPELTLLDLIDAHMANGPLANQEAVKPSPLSGSSIAEIAE